MKNKSLFALIVTTLVLSFTTNCSILTTGTAFCGDGILDSIETCDDGNLADGDGCSSTCTVETAAAITTGTATNPEVLASPTAAAPTSVGGSIMGTNDYYYSVPVTAGATIKADLISLMTLPDLLVYADSAYSTLLCSASASGSVLESCNAISPAGGNLYIKIGNSAGVTSTYTLTLTPVLPYTSGDGTAELTGVPAVTGGPLTTATPTAITIDVPVDTDTGYALACLVDRSNGTNSCAFSTTAVYGVMTMTITPPANKFTAGNYVYVRVYVSTSSSAAINLIATKYDILSGSTNVTYQETINAGTPQETLVDAPTLTVN